MPQTPKADPIKHCETCGVLMTRKRFGARLEDHSVFMRRRFCSLTCANTNAVVGKNAHHRRAKKFRATTCALCRATEGLHVHHLDRNHENDDPTNLITLCASCHLKLHWREDRDKRMAAMRRNPLQPCVMCGIMFHPIRAKTQTCSPACKSALLSKRTTDHYESRWSTGVYTPLR
jgi:5-methylcytosine-specific restriction endonuclease McrA